MAEALGRELLRAGARLSLWSRTARRATALRRRLVTSVGGSARRVRTAARLGQALAGEEAWVLCVSDDAIAEVAERAAAAVDAGVAPARVALHTNGFHGTPPLLALERAGLATGVLHPLVPLPPSAPVLVDERPLRGAWFAVTGAPRARTLARRVVRALGGSILELGDAPEAARSYHAGASLLAGGVVALFDAALAAVVRGARDPRAARRALLALLEGSVANLAVLSPEDALTGPAARGAKETLRAQLEVLARSGRGPGEPAALYRALLPRMLALAEARGAVTSAERRALERLL
ncbi:MAG: DUF2520 domain-containing protein [Planctomycetota bacterium]|nr:DUF2520 domain-containing protein [Planctomycetota bacterium]